MQHKYFLSDDLNELEEFHDELVELGIDHNHIHLWVNQPGNIKKSRILPINDFMKTDVVHSTIRGAFLGALVALLVLCSSLIIGHHDELGIYPYVCVALVCLGLVTWEGGLWGIQNTHHKFKQHADSINHNKFMLMLDFQQKEYEALRQVEKKHTSLKELSV